MKYGADFAMKEYRNILVYALVNLGDVVLSTSAIVLLRKAYPQARITMMVRPVVRQAVENNPVIDDILVFDYKAKGRSFSRMLMMIRDLRKRKFDLAVSFDRKLRPALLCLLAGIPVRVGPERVFDDEPSRVTWFYTHTIPITHDLECTLQAETYQEIVRGFTGIRDHAKPVFARIENKNYSKAKELLQRLPSADQKIALCIKGTFELKTWPKEYFIRVVTALKQRHSAAFFVVGAPSDRAYADELIAETPVPILNFCGETDLVDLAAIFLHTDLFVTVDTGATHIAATTGVPMVTMYGCTSPKRWHPINPNARVLTTGESCCPCKCSPQECPSQPAPKCLWRLGAEQVREQCEALLAAGKSSRSI